MSFGILSLTTYILGLMLDVHMGDVDPTDKGAIEGVVRNIIGNNNSTDNSNSNSAGTVTDPPLVITTTTAVVTTMKPWLNSESNVRNQEKVSLCVTTTVMAMLAPSMTCPW